MRLWRTCDLSRRPRAMPRRKKARTAPRSEETAASLVDVHAAAAAATVDATATAAAAAVAAATAAAAAATAAAAGHHRHRQTPPQPTPLATPRPTGSTPQCRRRCGATLTPTGGEAEDAVGRMLAGPTEFACTVTAQVRRSGHSVSELQLQPGRRDPTFRATLPRVRGCSFVSYIGMSCQGSEC